LTTDFALAAGWLAEVVVFRTAVLAVADLVVAVFATVFDALLDDFFLAAILAPCPKTKPQGSTRIPLR